MVRGLLAWIFALWVAGAAASAPQEEGVVSSAPADRVRYLLEGPARAAIAEAFQVELVVQHGPELAVRLDAANLAPERGWLLLAEPVGLERAEAQGQRTTRFHLVAAPLATGGEVDGELRFQPAQALAWPELEVQLVPARGGDDVRERWTVPGFAVEVPAALAPDADAPPAPLGLGALEAPAIPRPWYEDPRAALGAGALVLLVLVWVWVRRARRAPGGAPVAARATARERIELALAKAPNCPVDERRALCFELASALRGEIDGRLGARRGALLEEEWLAALAAEPGGPSVAEPMGALLAASAAVRWGRAEPSVYALEEQVQLARAALVALDAMDVHRGERAA